MTKLSVNINKIATIRNARGGAIPDVVKAALLLSHVVLMELQSILDLIRDILDMMTFIVLKGLENGI